MVLLCLVVTPHVHADHQGPWTRHTIDNSSEGADGVRLADADGDGLMDIVTGWEEGGIVRLYLNPGPEKAKETWPAVTVGNVKNVEDAVMADLDGDGAIDVVSSCEGKTKSMYVHWGPKDQAKLLDEDAWATEAIPATSGLQQWMYCLPMQIDGEHGIDLFVGSKGKGAAVGWLSSPEKPRDLGDWTYHKLRDAGWIMSIEPIGTEPPSVLVTDRAGDERGIYRLGYHSNRWSTFEIEMGEAEYMFAAPQLHEPNAWITATRDGELRLYTHHVRSRAYRHITTIAVPNPFGVQRGKAVAMGDIDGDGQIDIVATHNTQRQADKPAVSWIRNDPSKRHDDRAAYDISGLEGKKFDRVELIDLDGDGDLDVLTCEEVDQLGVVWYENPYANE
jgi:hypothetical protein